MSEFIGIVLTCATAKYSLIAVLSLAALDIFLAHRRGY